MIEPSKHEICLKINKLVVQALSKRMSIKVQIRDSQGRWLDYEGDYTK